MTTPLSLADVLHSAPRSIAYAGTSVTVQRHGFRPILHQAICRWTGQEHRMINAGFGGVGTPGALAMLGRWVLPHEPSVCFVETSVVDQSQAGRPPLLAECLRAIIARLRMDGCEPVLLHMPRVGDFGPCPQSVLKVHHDVAEATGTLAITIPAPSDNDRASYLSDVVHLTPDGADWAADHLARALKSALPRITLQAHRPQDVLDLRLLKPSLDDVVGGSPLKGRFRLVEEYVEFGGDSQLHVDLRDRRLFGLLHIVGPHSGAVRIAGMEYGLKDQWSNRDRLHATFFDQPATGKITIAPVGDGSLPDPLMRVVDLITLPAP